MTFGHGTGRASLTMTDHLRPSLLCLLFALLLAPKLAAAQGIYPYALSRRAAAYTTIVNAPSTTLLAASDLDPILPGLDPEDEGQTTIPLPFEFKFFGETYDEITVYVNGVLAFEAPPGPLDAKLQPATQVPSPDGELNGFIAPQWEDFFMEEDSRIAHRTVGSPGGRVFTIEWSRVVVAGSSSGDVSFQVELREATQSIRVNYGPSVLVNQATASVEGPRGRDGFDLLNCIPGSCASVDFLGDDVLLELPAGVDLVGRTDAPFGAEPGASFDATVVIQNGGRSPSPGGDWRLSIAPIGMVSGARLLGSGSFGPLGGVEQVAISDSFVVPADQPVGAFELLLEIDPDELIPEFREDNNVLFGPSFGTGPDLVGSFGDLGSQIGPGGTIRVDLEIASEGAPTQRPFDVDFRLEGVQGNLVATLGRQRLAIADGVSEVLPIELTIPAVVPLDELVRVRASLDSTSRVPEIFELNNEVLSAPVFTRSANPRIPAVDIEVRPPFYRGESFSLAFTVGNGGPAPALDIDICVTLGAREILRIPDQDLPPSAAPRPYRVEPVVPTSFSVGEGNLELVIDVDCSDRYPPPRPDAPEALDDTFTIPGVTIEAPSADLEPEIVDQVQEAEAGEVMPLRIRVLNRGILSTAYTGVVELLDGQGEPASSFDFEDRNALRPGEEHSLDLVVQLPPELASGAYTPRVTVAATSANEREGNNDSLGEDVSVSGFGVALVNTEPFPAILGQPYTYRFGLLGGSPRSYDISWPNGPPPGLQFAEGQLDGTPTELGSFPFALEVDTELGDLSVSGTLLVLTPALPLTVVDGALPPALVDEFYREQITILGGRPPYDVSATAEPAGLNLQSDGTLLGSCASPSSVFLSIQVLDSLGNAALANVGFECVGRGGLQIALPALPDGLVDRPYEAQATVTGGTAPLSYRLEGELPPGIEFDLSTGRFSGTPERAGDFPIFVEVRDAQGRLDRNPFNLRIFEAGAIQILSPGNVFPEGEVGEVYPEGGGSFGVEVTGANPDRPLIWMLGQGDVLPPGLSFSDGAISGTPTEAGLYPFTILVTDASIDVSRRFFAIRIRDRGEAPSAALTDGGCRAQPPSTWLLFLVLAGLLPWMKGRRPEERRRR